MRYKAKYTKALKAMQQLEKQNLDSKKLKKIKLCGIDENKGYIVVEDTHMAIPLGLYHFLRQFDAVQKEWSK